MSVVASVVVIVVAQRECSTHDNIQFVPNLRFLFGKNLKEKAFMLITISHYLFSLIHFLCGFSSLT